MEYNIVSINSMSEMSWLANFLLDQEIPLNAFQIKEKIAGPFSNEVQKVILYSQDIADMAVLAMLVEWYPKFYRQSRAFGPLVVANLFFPAVIQPDINVLNLVSKSWGIPAEELRKAIVFSNPFYYEEKVFPKEGFFNCFTI